MVRSPVLALLLVTLCLPMTSCYAMTRIVAERCVLIDLHGKAGRELIPLLDSFAQEHDLVPDKSHPISPSYERRNGKTIHADVIYTIGMGRFGAELSLFRFDAPRDADLLSAFDRLIEEQIAPKYKVTWCKDVPDYQIPQVYR